MKISMKLVYQYMAILFNFLPTSNHLHLLQVENCGSNSRLVVDEDDNGKLRLERVKHQDLLLFEIYLFQEQVVVTHLKLWVEVADTTFSG